MNNLNYTKISKKELEKYFFINFNLLKKDSLNCDALAETILHSVTEEKVGVLFSMLGEAFYYPCIYNIEKVIRILLDRYNFDINKTFLLVSAEPVIDNINSYIEWCKKNNYVAIPNLLFNNTFESNAANELMFDTNFVTVQNLSTITKKKNFLFFNGMSRPHRLWLIGEILLRNLQDNFYMSMQSTAPDILKRLPLISKCNKEFNKIETIITKNIELFPMTLTHKGINHGHTIHDLKLYNDSYISLVSETVFFKDMAFEKLWEFDGWHVRSMYFTEKTWKAVKAKHPFILAGPPHMLKRLKEIGYKTFSPWINESYDNIENDVQRIEAIVDELERLCKFTDKDWLDFQEFIIPIVEHNFSTLKSKANYDEYLYHNNNSYFYPKIQ